MAKINTLFVLVSVLVVILFAFILMSVPEYLPYSNNKYSYADYEPFSDYNEKSVDDSKNGGDTQSVKVNGSSEVNSNSTAPLMSGNVSLSSIGSSIINMITPGTENFEPLIEVPRSVKYGVFRDSEIIDKFSQVKTNGMDGVDGCISSGLSNSGGYICLTPELVQLLKSRGGNATGM